MKAKIKSMTFNEEKIDICEDCGNPLPEPILEQREGGYSELVTYCPSCGSTFTS